MAEPHESQVGKPELGEPYTLAMDVPLPSRHTMHWSAASGEKFDTVLARAIVEADYLAKELELARRCLGLAVLLLGGQSVFVTELLDLKPFPVKVVITAHDGMLHMRGERL